MGYTSSKHRNLELTLNIARGEKEGCCLQSQIGCERHKIKTLPQAKRHKPSLLFTSLTIFISLTFFGETGESSERGESGETGESANTGESGLHLYHHLHRYLHSPESHQYCRRTSTQ